eukprot:849147-Ditylum_brightwellii.AAC.1
MWENVSRDVTDHTPTAPKYPRVQGKTMSGSLKSTEILRPQEQKTRAQSDPGTGDWRRND